MRSAVKPSKIETLELVGVKMLYIDKEMKSRGVLTFPMMPQQRRALHATAPTPTMPIMLPGPHLRRCLRKTTLRRDILDVRRRVAFLRQAGRGCRPYQH